MSEDTTKNLSPEQMFMLILSRLDSVDARLDSMDTQLTALESKSHDTRPIWERALSEILEVKDQLEKVNERLDQAVGRFDIVGGELLALRANQSRLDRRVTQLERDQTPPERN